MSFSIRFVPSGRGKAQCAPDPNYPNGIDIRVAQDGQISCTADLPYPAPECGHFLIDCKVCNLRIAITAAGRPDDPRTITVPCQFLFPQGAA